MRIVGIDVGLEGAVAISCEREVYEVELLKNVTPEWIREMSCAAFGMSVHVFIEKAQAMPGQGVSSMFNYGTGFGKLLGWMEALKLPHTLVTPREWTKEMHKGCTGENAKEKSLQAAKRLFPHMKLEATERSKKPHAGIVDALLIAEFGRRLMTLRR